MYWGLCRAVSNLVSSEVHVKYSFEVQREGFDIKKYKVSSVQSTECRVVI